MSTVTRRTFIKLLSGGVLAAVSMVIDLPIQWEHASPLMQLKGHQFKIRELGFFTESHVVQTATVKLNDAVIHTVCVGPGSTFYWRLPLGHEIRVVEDDVLILSPLDETHAWSLIGQTQDERMFHVGSHSPPMYLEA